MPSIHKHPSIALALVGILFMSILSLAADGEYTPVTFPDSVPSLLSGEYLPLPTPNETVPTTTVKYDALDFFKPILDDKYKLNFTALQSNFTGNNPPLVIRDPSLFGQPLDDVIAPAMKLPADKVTPEAWARLLIINSFPEKVYAHMLGLPTGFEWTPKDTYANYTLLQYGNKTVINFLVNNGTLSNLDPIFYPYPPTATVEGLKHSIDGSYSLYDSDITDSYERYYYRHSYELNIIFTIKAIEGNKTSRCVVITFNGETKKSCGFPGDKVDFTFTLKGSVTGEKNITKPYSGYIYDDMTLLRESGGTIIKTKITREKYSFTGKIKLIFRVSKVTSHKTVTANNTTTTIPVYSYYPYLSSITIKDRNPTLKELSNLEARITSAYAYLNTKGRDDLRKIFEYAYFTKMAEVVRTEASKTNGEFVMHLNQIPLMVNITLSTPPYDTLIHQNGDPRWLAYFLNKAAFPVYDLHPPQSFIVLVPKDSSSGGPNTFTTDNLTTSAPYIIIEDASDGKEYVGFYFNWVLSNETGEWVIVNNYPIHFWREYNETLGEWVPVEALPKAEDGEERIIDGKNIPFNVTLTWNGDGERVVFKKGYNPTPYFKLETELKATIVKYVATPLFWWED